MAARALTLGFDVRASDPGVADHVIAAAGVKPMALDELLASSDVVSLHAPLLPATRGLLGAAQIARLPRGRAAS